MNGWSGLCPRRRLRGLRKLPDENRGCGWCWQCYLELSIDSLYGWDCDSKSTYNIARNYRADEEGHKDCVEGLACGRGDEADDVNFGNWEATSDCVGNMN